MRADRIPTRSHALFPAILSLLFAVLLLPAVAQAAPVVKSVGIVKDAGGDIVTIECSEKPDYEFFLIDGQSLVIDIFEASNEAWPTARDADTDHLGQLNISEHFSPRQMVRVLLQMKGKPPHNVRAEGNKIIATVGRPGERAAQPAAAQKVAYITTVDFIPLKERSRIRINASGPLDYQVEDSGAPERIRLVIPDARLSAAVDPLDLTLLERELQRVDVYEKPEADPPAVIVAAVMGKPAPFKVVKGKTGLTIDIDRIAPPGTEPEAAVPTPSADMPPVNYGRKISLDLVDAEIKDVLLIISDVSGINFVAGDEVKGNVTMRLVEVPWEVALETILMTNTPPLDQVPITENIVRVSTKALIADEARRRLQAAREKAEREKFERDQAEALAREAAKIFKSREFSLSYAQVNDVMNILGSFLSEDGTITPDPRTNTLFVRDLLERMAQIEYIVSRIDKPIPTVIVEARIVEVTSTAAEQLGIKWGAEFFADPAHGNALPVEFPNSIGITGGIQDEEGNNLMVNMPSASPAGGIGLSFGHIANTLSLDLTLQALEQLNEVKILSQPRVLVVQNQEATINLGQQLPIPATDAEGNRVVTFTDVGIKLVVTPQVTNDGKVFMDINVEKSSRGENVPTTEGLMFSINSRRAETQVLIDGGETAVIGGLTVEESARIDTMVPKLSKLPVLGWLFKSKDSQIRRDEMMIFLTPRIVSPS